MSQLQESTAIMSEWQVFDYDKGFSIGVEHG